MISSGKAPVVFCLLIAVSTALDGCKSSGMGPIPDAGCPTGFTAAKDDNGEEVCCADNEIVPATKAPIVKATTTATNTCKDLLNPVTGVSDCPKRSYLCNDSVYFDVMTVQCPKTCGRCGSSSNTTSYTCVDKTNPSTGVSDCAQRKEYCTNSLYKTLMTEQCPKTCGFC